MRIKIDLDDETTEQLMKAAAAERRPLPWQAEVLLKRALEQLGEANKAGEVAQCSH